MNFRINNINKGQVIPHYMPPVMKGYLLKDTDNLGKYKNNSEIRKRSKKWIN